MFLINVIIVLIYIMLALISRKHFSKYKKGGVVGYLTCIFDAMGEMIHSFIGSKISSEENKKNLRKCYVVSPGKLNDISERYVARGISIILGVFFAFNLISGVLSLWNIIGKEESVNIVMRDDYGGDEEKYKITLEKNGNTYEYCLNVAPIEYSVEEVCQKAEEVFVWLEGVILSDNIDLQHISQDLYLPPMDEENLFEIAWDSDNPMLITSDGKVVKENIENGDQVVITAELTYLEYVFQKDYNLALEVESDEDADIAKVKEILLKLEAESRTSKEILLPDNIQGIQVSLKNVNDSQQEKVMLFGVVLCGCILLLRRERLKDAGKKRDSMLLKKYPVFVNKLYLLMWTGMTIKNALIHFVSKTNEKDILVKEIEYTLNQISSGIDEAVAYEDLGQRLMLPEYIRLMNQIAHNLKRGNYDLLDCMEEEVGSVRTNRKENARRLGEEASTKLLFPMILLLVVVMVIVIIPAITGF